MPKGGVYWIFVSAIVVGVVGYRVSQDVAGPLPEIVHGQVPRSEAPAISPTARQQNPLLSADRTTVQRWFPFTCFAEIYMESGEPGNCKALVIANIKADTGVLIAEADFQNPEVVAHFKNILGSDGPWRW